MGKIAKALQEAGKELDSLKQQFKELKARVAKTEMRIDERAAEDVEEE